VREPRAREERQFPTNVNDARIVCANAGARSARTGKKTVSRKTKLGAPKRVSASAHVGSARDRRLMYVYDRRRRPRRAAGRVCTRLGFRVLTVEGKWRGLRVALARSKKHAYIAG